MSEEIQTKVMSPIVHFEIPADDPETATKFYNEVFGWNTDQWENMPYWMARTAEIDEETRLPKKAGVINGGIMKRSAEIKNPVLTINVDSIEATLEKIESTGGRTIKTKDAVGDMGWTAYFADPSGNVMGLWENKS